MEKIDTRITNDGLAKIGPNLSRWTNCEVGPSTLLSITIILATAMARNSEKYDWIKKGSHNHRDLSVSQACNKLFIRCCLVITLFAYH